MLMPMMVVMITSSIVGGQIISKTGRYKMIGVVGMGLVAVGLFLLSGIGPFFYLKLLPSQKELLSP
jgi:hypothetical protein